jgi:AraC-like DNA-binding protein
MPGRIPDDRFVQPTLDIPSRDQEISRVVLNWLNRLEFSLQDEYPGLYAEALARAGISPHQVQATGGLTHEHFDRVMELTRRSAPDAFFRFMSVLELTDLGMLGYAVLSCPTLGKGMELLGRYLELTSDRFNELRLQEEDFFVIRPAPTWRHLGEDQSIAEDCIAGNWRAVRIMLGPERLYERAVIRFAFSRPAYHNVIDRFFHPGKVIYDAAQSELQIPAAWLGMPLETGNATMSDMTAAACERFLGSSPGSRQDTRRAVWQLLLSRPGQRMLRLEEAAAVMAMSTAQLRKRLYRAGTSYKRIVLAVRMNLGLHFLNTTSLTVQEIASLLDYTQPGPFSRAFKKCYGVSPGEFRNKSSEMKLLNPQGR